MRNTTKLDAIRSIAGIIVIAIIAFAVIGCKDEPETPPPVTVTKTVTVTFPAFSAGTSLNLTPTYTPTDGWGEFSQSDITYTITSNLPKTYNSSNSFTANISDGYANDTTYTFTQTFTGKTVGNKTIRVRVLSGNFASLRDDSDEAGKALDPQAIPPITLTLTKSK